jgi:hypothetical protein
MIARRQASDEIGSRTTPRRGLESRSGSRAAPAPVIGVELFGPTARPARSGRRRAGTQGGTLSAVLDGPKLLADHLGEHHPFRIALAALCSLSPRHYALTRTGDDEPARRIRPATNPPATNPGRTPRSRGERCSGRDRSFGRLPAAGLSLGRIAAASRDSILSAQLLVLLGARRRSPYTDLRVVICSGATSRVPPKDSHGLRVPERGPPGGQGPISLLQGIDGAFRSPWAADSTLIRKPRRAEAGPRRLCRKTRHLGRCSAPGGTPPRIIRAALSKRDRLAEVVKGSGFAATRILGQRGPRQLDVALEAFEGGARQLGATERRATRPANSVCDPHAAGRSW